MDDLSKFSSLYHYTNLKGFEGIITSNSLWAIHYSLLNDHAELKVGWDWIRKIAREVSEQNKATDTNEAASILTDEIIKEALIRITPSPDLEFYITSFCGFPYTNSQQTQLAADDGLLSQWRGYSQKSPVAIVFNRQKLEEFYKNASHDSNIFDSVLYHFNEQDTRNKTQQRDDQIQSFINQLIPTNQVQSFERPSRQQITALLEIITLLKHPAFFEENEVRFVYIEPHQTPQFHRRNDRITKYHELQHDSLKNTIEKVIIGPHPEQLIISEYVEDFLRRHDISSPVIRCTIPYTMPLAHK